MIGRVFGDLAVGLHVKVKVRRRWGQSPPPPSFLIDAPDVAGPRQTVLDSRGRLVGLASEAWEDLRNVDLKFTNGGNRESARRR